MKVKEKVSAAMESNSIKREKRGKRSLTEKLVGRAPKKDGMDDDRVLPDVDPESIRTPAASGLDGVEVSSSFSKRGSTARSK